MPVTRSGKASSTEQKEEVRTSSMVPMEKVRALAKAGRVAMVVDGIAWDFTEFADDHPGGPEYLRKNAGKVCTEEFVASHPVDIIERTLTAAQFDEDGEGVKGSMRLGPVDPTTILPSDIPEYKGHAPSPAAGAVVSTGEKPSLEGCINVCDFEAIARVTVPEQGWVYYSSGSDDEITLRENHSAFQRMWLRPRVLVNVKEVDTSTTVLGKPSSLPLMLCAVAMCKLGHPDGEIAWNKAAGREGIVYMIPTLSGCKFDDITGAAKPDQAMFFQLYVNQDRAKTKKLVQKAEKNGCTGLFITVDAPQLGNREKDRRVKVSHAGAAVQSGTSVKKSEGTAKALTTFIDPSLCWDDIDWFASITDMKIALKGIATAEDAVMALEHGKVSAIMLSNHGGRQLDGARSAIEILPEVMTALRAHPKYDPATFEVYIDGGIRRGTDIYKALALGATAVGIGRPALYAMSAFGEEGVARCIQILRDELEMTMRLMGTKTLADIKESSVITTDLHTHVTPVPTDYNSVRTYQPKVTQAYKTGFLPDATTQKINNAIKNSAPAAAAASPSTTTTTTITDKSTVETFVGLFKIMLSTIFQSVFANSASAVLHKSALLLVAYLVVHCLGVCTVFLGKDILNEYGHKLHENPAIKFVEYYLLIGAVLHALVAAYLTYKKRRFIMSKPIANGKLAISSVIVTVFTVLHVLSFRFGPEKSDVTGNSYTLSGGAKDLYQMAMDLFADPLQVAFYTISVGAVGVHLWVGWTKTVNKMEATKEEKAAYNVMGKQLVVPLCAGFAAVPCYLYYLGLSS